MLRNMGILFVTKYASYERLPASEGLPAPRDAGTTFEYSGVDNKLIDFWNALPEVDQKSLWDQSLKETRDLRHVIEDAQRRATSPDVTRNM